MKKATFNETESLLTKFFISFSYSSLQMFEPNTEDPNYNPLPEEQPGGFPWGEQPRQ